MRQQPTGTVTFLFTDIEGSTKLWETYPDAMRPALARHDQLLREVIERSGGHVFKTVGDAFCAAFPVASNALAGALAAQLALVAEPWSLEKPLRVRMALHTGIADIRDGDYFGQPLNRVARLLSAGHGGQTLVSGATEELIRDALPGSTGLIDLGMRRLKDLGRPEHVFEMAHPSLPADFAPLRTLDNPDLPNNLPQQVTSFVGREKQIIEVKSLLEKSRLLTLTGTGGAGKTRLALAVAADLLDRYFDGAWLVELASLSDPALVTQAVADELSVQEKANQPISKTLTEWLKPKRLLLILDNCEHVVAACADLATRLLKNCPDVSLLVTSRERLNVAGEQTYRVPSLTVPDGMIPQSVSDVSRCEAVRLFVDRAKSVHSSFSITDANAPAMAQVCRRLDGIPLALELAAARVRVLPVEEVNARLDDRFKLLTGGSQTLLPRQQTLRALIDWSYDLLTDQERRLLRRLAVFSSGWTLEAVESVCSDKGINEADILDLLTSLIDKSLVMCEEQDQEMPRYRLLETIRHYGRERLDESGEAEDVQSRHQHFFLALAEQAAPRLRGPEAGAWLFRLEREHDNLRAALSWCETGSDPSAEAGLRLSGALWRFWEVRGHYSEGRHWLETALRRADGEPPSVAQAQALNGAGNLSWRQGDHDAANVLLTKSLEMMRQIGDHQGVAHALHNLGTVAFRQNDIGAARAFFEQSLEIKRQIGDNSGIANGLLNLGSVAWNQGDYGAARALYLQSLDLMRQNGDKGGIALALGNLGAVASEQGDHGTAYGFYEQSLEIMREVGDRSGVAKSLEGMAGAASARGNGEAAYVLFEQCLGDYRQIGDQRGIADALEGMAVVVLARGDDETSRDLFEQCLAIQRKIGNQWGIANALEGLADAASRQENLEAARTQYSQCLGIRRQIGDKLGIACSMEGLAGISASQGDGERGACLWASADALREQIGTPQAPQKRQQQEQQIFQVRQSLGDKAFSTAWDLGRAMTLDEAVEYALSGN